MFLHENTDPAPVSGMTAGSVLWGVLEACGVGGAGIEFGLAEEPLVGGIAADDAFGVVAGFEIGDVFDPEGDVVVGLVAQPAADASAAGVVGGGHEDGVGVEASGE